MGNMKVSKAKQRWKDVRKAAQSGDPAAMMDAVSRFQGIADTMLLYFANRDGLRDERDQALAQFDECQRMLGTAKAEADRFRQAMTFARVNVLTAMTDADDEKRRFALSVALASINNELWPDQSLKVEAKA
jgi:hypothetical protein